MDDRMPPDEELRNSDAYYHVVLERIPPRAEPAFEAQEMQERVWGRTWGVHNDVGRLRLCVVHRPGDEMTVIDPRKYDSTIAALIDDDEQWYWRDRQGPDIARMQAQHNGLVAALRSEGVEVVYVDGPPGDPKAVFTRDQAIAVKGGAVICRMGPVGSRPGYGRRGEEAYMTRLIAGLGMPILRTIHGTGLLEGGSFCFLNETTAAVGMSFRQNEAGVRQIEQVLAEQGVRLVRVPLTGHSLHLDGCIVMVDYDKAIVNVTRLPYWFLDLLTELGIQVIHVWPTEQKAVNCLAVRPGRVIIAAGCPRTVERLHRAGIETIEIPYDEVHKNGGGIHCSTLPLVRDP
ncbi:arginine deiminase family protein [Thermomicrobiaceae bacterium CFH 74404]|uniref:arginine deiminase n=1 Tax=Thermalbibacter longus TaxID=2951981 RepID=A0AA41WEM5_9BACT|nr:arginine deiminase family protein [Thermalbibacter longus]MCM8748975.1 arginine deiminase family protein [Thermalbibacter longus]